jgi:hypothetical protein
MILTWATDEKKVKYIHSLIIGMDRRGQSGMNFLNSSSS